MTFSYNPYCWGHLVLVRSPRTILTYQKLERNALIWSYFQNVWCGRLWGHWGQRIFAVEFRGYGPEILFSFLIVWLSTLRKLSQTVPKFWLIDFIALDLFDFGNDIECSLTLTSKMATPNILKIASNQCIFSKYWWEVWILGGDRT